MLKRTLLTMTAISILTGPAFHGTAMAGQFNKPVFRMTGPQLKMRIDTRRLATRKDTRKAALPAVQSAAIQPPAKAKAGPQPEPPTRPKRTNAAKFAKPAPLPNPRPYNEFDEGGADAGPATELPEDNTLFDEDLIAQLPETWGEFPIDILAGLDRGAIDGAFDNPPDVAGPFPPGDNGPDLTGINPGDYVQRGGPNDPEAGGKIPEFFDDPRNQGTDAGPRGAKEAPAGIRPGDVPDPRGIASDGELPAEDEIVPAGGRSDGSAVHQTDNNNAVAHVRLYITWDNKRISFTTIYRENSTENVATRDSVIDGYSVSEYFERNDHQVYEGVSMSFRKIGGPKRQPLPIDGASDTRDYSSLCGTMIPMWMCMRGAGGGATPGDMLTQPSETDSIMSSGDGPDLGAEAVTNTGDASWNTTDSRGNGSGGGGSGMDWRNPGDPDGPDGPNGT